MNGKEWRDNIAVAIPLAHLYRALAPHGLQNNSYKDRV